MIGVAAVIYIVVREVTEGSAPTAIANAKSLYDLESSIGIAWEASVQAFVLDRPWLRDIANWIYVWGHWPVIATVSIFLFARHRASYTRLRNAVLASGLIGFAFFYLMPMAPPRLAGIGLVDTITTWSSSYRTLQPPQYANIYAAMPSLHFGWDLLVGVTVFLSVRGPLRFLGLLMPTCMAFAVIATANHFVLDVVVGGLVVATGAVFAEAARRAFDARRPRQQALRARGRRQPVRDAA